MISAYTLEQSGKWRPAWIAGILFLTILPALLLVWAAMGSDEASASLSLTFGREIVRSLAIGAAVALISVLVGWPTGVLAGLYDFPGRMPLLGTLAVPLLIPSFLWAIGLSMLRIHLGLPRDSILSGATGTVIAFSALALPLVVYTALVATRGLSQGQADSATLAGGDRTLVWHAAKATLSPSLLIGALAGILTLADPGPGQILGFSGAASEILVSFSALYDFPLAAKQALSLAVVALAPIVPIATWIAPKIVSELIARDVRPARLQKRPWASFAIPLLLGGISTFVIVLPLIGFIQPLFREFPIARAWEEVSRTFRNTLLYAAIAGGIATVLGLLLAIAVGRFALLRKVTITGLLLILCLPPSLGALGIVQVATAAPALMDILLRSRFTVGLLLAFRFLPIAAFLAFRAIGQSSSTWTAAAAIHGVSLWQYLKQVLIPWTLPTSMISFLLIALLATAEINIVLLLRPPGEDSLPISIFTVMANAPEALVSALCLLYITGAMALLSLGWLLVKRRSTE